MSTQFSLLPSEMLRISRRQVQLLLADVKPIVCGSLTVEAGFFSLSNLPGFSPERRARQLEFERQNQQPHLELLAFYRRLSAVVAGHAGQNRYRICLNEFEARAGAVALRLGRRKRKPDPASSITNTPEMDRRRSRLLRRLVNLSRRLHRKFEAEAGKVAYAEFCKSFADYRDRILDRLYPSRKNRLHRGGSRRPWVAIVDDACQLACQGLKELGYEDTTPQKIRPLIRRFLAYARRGRIRFSIYDLYDISPFTRLRLADFIVKSWEKQVRKQKSTNQRRSHDQALGVAPQAA